MTKQTPQILQLQLKVILSKNNLKKLLTFTKIYDKLILLIITQGLLQSKGGTLYEKKFVQLI